MSTVPAGVTVRETNHVVTGSTVTISCRWPWGMPLVLFIALPACMFGCIQLIGNSSPAPVPIGAYVLASVGTLGTGVYFAYSYFNRTVYTLSNEVLSVHHGPLPYPGSRSIPSSSIEAAFVRRTVAKSSKGDRTYFHLVIVSHGHTIDFDSFVDHEGVPLFLKSKIEQRFGLSPHEDELS